MNAKIKDSISWRLQKAEDYIHEAPRIAMITSEIRHALSMMENLKVEIEREIQTLKMRGGE